MDKSGCVVLALVALAIGFAMGVLFESNRNLRREVQEDDQEQQQVQTVYVPYRPYSYPGPWPSDHHRRRRHY